MTGNFSKMLGFCFSLVAITPAYGEERVTFFGGGIDFWGDKEAKKDQPATSQPQKEENKPEKFEWQKYMDPKNKEFFQEGNYTPPEPFMEVVRNPTEENLKMWFNYIEKKNLLSRNFQERLKQYAGADSNKLEPEAKNEIRVKAASIDVSDVDSKRYRFRMYFDSHCPHCKRMFGTLVELMSRGFYVEARQVDNDRKAVVGLPIPTEQASKQEVERQKVEGVPLLLVGDLQRKEVIRIQGYQDVTSILQALKAR